MGRAIDLLITYRVIKMLITPFEKTKAFQLGIIDKNGKVLRKAKTLTKGSEKNAYTLERLDTNDFPKSRTNRANRWTNYIYN